MTASMDFYVGFTPDNLSETGMRVAERGDYEVFNLEGIAYLAWDDDRPKAVELYAKGYRLAKPREALREIPGPLADMALERINQDHYALQQAWNESQDGEAADAAYSRYEAVE